MNLFVLSSAMEFLGTLLVAITALSVHLKLRKEKSIDAQVSTQIGKEKILGYIGIILLIVGFSLEIYLYL